MPYDLSAFRCKAPTLHECVVIDPEREVALHVARWPYPAFDSLEDFVRFTYRYSCVLQPFIFDPVREDLDGWFHPDPASDARADDLLKRETAKNQEAREWMRQFYPSVTIDWLNAGLHGKIVSMLDGEWPEMLGYDTEGFFCVFAADAT